MNVAGHHGLLIQRLQLSQIVPMLHLEVNEITVPIIQLYEIPEHLAVFFILLEFERIHDLLEALVFSPAFFAVDGVVSWPRAFRRAQVAPL